MDSSILFIETYKLFKRRRAWVGPVLVFLLIIISFPLTLDINSDNPPQIYLSFIWISTLLVTMLGTELIFSEDFEDGTLEQYAVNNQLIEIVFYKILVHWVLIGIPLAFVAFLFTLSLRVNRVLAASLLCLVRNSFSEIASLKRLNSLLISSTFEKIATAS